MNIFEWALFTVCSFSCLCWLIIMSYRHLYFWNSLFQSFGAVKLLFEYSGLIRLFGLVSIKKSFCNPLYFIDQKIDTFEKLAGFLPSDKLTPWTNLPLFLFCFFPLHSTSKKWLENNPGDLKLDSILSSWCCVWVSFPPLLWFLQGEFIGIAFVIKGLNWHGK